MSGFPFRPTRRDLMRLGAAGGLGAILDHGIAPASETLPRLKPTADAVIFVHLKGGPSHLDSLDMKPDGPVEERGEFKPISSSVPGLVVCEHLPNLAKTIHQFCLIRGISHSAGAHPQADEWLFTGNRPSAAVSHPSLGSVAGKERPSRPDLPPFISIPTSEMGPGFLGVEYSAFKTTTIPKPGQPFEVRGLSLPAGVTSDQVRNRDKLLADLDTALAGAENSNPVVAGMNRFGKSAAEMILSTRTREAFDIAKEPASISKLFPTHDLGQSLLLACRLIEQGARFITVNHDGWDTHLENFTGHKRLLPQIDSAATAAVEALRQKGLLERTLVVINGEFGRTPTINKNAGRDHWPRASWSLFIGGGVKPGLIGGTDEKGHGADSGTKISLDDLAASIVTALGIHPRTEYYTPTNRPVMLVPNGRVIEGLFGS